MLPVEYVLCLLSVVIGNRKRELAHEGVNHLNELIVKEAVHHEDGSIADIVLSNTALHHHAHQDKHPLKKQSLTECWHPVKWSATGVVGDSKRTKTRRG